MCDLKGVIKNADMSKEMQQDSVECATQVLEKYNIEKDIAAHIKECDKKYNPTWHCIVGQNFGSYVTQTLHLLLPGPGGHSSVRIWLKVWTMPHTQ
ncbi:Dynein light chain 1, cytoplasmic [Sciurus carolinensis]|uniref:Dynein light chain n=1 Tax=Sciurus carolinensis TaxID=30640 RepID=A0AA41MZB3_SCICA|nr:Dynein light chain 1, cytoplasmic [Sciurus carolinensis]